jgi:hypothetical protein
MEEGLTAIIGEGVPCFTIPDAGFEFLFLSASANKNYHVPSMGTCSCFNKHKIKEDPHSP